MNADLSSGQKAIVVAPSGFIFVGTVADAQFPGHIRLEKPKQILGWDGNKGIGAVASGEAVAELQDASDWIELPEFSYRLVLDASKMKM